MRRLVLVPVLLGLLGLATSVTQAAPMTATATLRPPAGNSNMLIAHATGTAMISYTKNGHDATISLTVEKLPGASALHASAYVLWLVNGTHRVRAGSFNVRNGMAGVHVMTMDTMFGRLIVTAESSPMAKGPMGIRVLTGAVMHH